MIINTTNSLRGKPPINTVPAPTPEPVSIPATPEPEPEPEPVLDSDI